MPRASTGTARYSVTTGDKRRLGQSTVRLSLERERDRRTAASTQALPDTRTAAYCVLCLSLVSQAEKNFNLLGSGSTSRHPTYVFTVACPKVAFPVPPPPWRFCNFLYIYVLKTPHVPTLTVYSVLCTLRRSPNPTA